MVRWALICLVFVLGGCRSADDAVIRFAVATAPSVLDPRIASDAASERVNELLYDRLVTLDDHGQPQPAMAEWERRSPTHYRLRLRPDRATFWDGAQPDATDVAATYRSVLDPSTGSPHASTLSHIDRIDVIDDSTLDFVLTREAPLFPSRLTIGIIPAEVIGQRNLARDPVGSGSFRFKRWRDDGGLLVERREDQQVVAFEPVADATMRALKLMRGEADLLQNDMPHELLDVLGEKPGLALQETRGITFAYIGFNLRDPALANHDVRAAIAHAIDRASIVRYMFGGRAELAESVLNPTHWAAGGELQAYAFDPEKARELLKRAGYDTAHPLKLTYKTSTDALRVRIAHVLQSQLADVGIELTIASYDWGTFFGDIKAGRFQMYGLAWVGVNSPDILRYAFHSESSPPAGANRGGYLSTDVDALIDRAERLDADAAAPLYAQIQQRVHADLVYVPLWYESNVAVSRNLSGYLPHYDGSYLSLNGVRKDHVAE
ncbi:ABC transporter substrate-binding protein [Thiosocius teredinicola]|uniref:ABC transporter substrate-binding protein n=1 Tax=Thiosocius teredinicola TaxID=1973002 RepID=UPI00099101B6